MLKILNTKEDAEILKIYLLEETTDWKLKDKKELFTQPNFDDIREVQYRPFDYRYTYYPLSKIDKIIVRGDSRKNVMRHFLVGENVGLLVGRQAITNNWSHVQVSNAIIDNRIHYSNKGKPVLFPLYLYSDGDTLHSASRKANLDLKIVKAFADSIKLEFEEEKTGNAKKFAPIDVLDYIYAVLHSPTYRERYKEFLKIDFPRVPYPDDTKKFRKLAKLGETLRQLHLLEGVEPKQGLANFGVCGNDAVDCIKYADGKVWINAMQYFDRVPEDVWNFYIGGYQPAQKWLKDRKCRELSHDDIEHYQKIVFVLQETLKLMVKVDEAMRHALESAHRRNGRR
jgi:predicted helicase